MHGRPLSRLHPCYPWERGRNSKFKKFFSWLQNTQGALPERSGDNLPLFPSMLPYPEAFAGCGESVCGRKGRSLWAKAYLNFWFGWSNYVVLGCPDCGGSTTEPRVEYRSIREARVSADRLLGEVEEFMDESFCTDELTFDGGRLSIAEALQQLVSSYALYGAGDCPGSLDAKASSAIPVVADRIAIPDEAGTVDPRLCLSELRSAVVDNLEALRLPEDQWKEVPVACHRVSEAEEAGLVKRLLDSKMVDLVPESELPRRNDGSLLTGGFFCVKKNNDEDRLIYDRRPENATMSRLDWAKLPSAACLTRVLLDPHEYLRGSGDDLRNYYYALALPPQWVKYNSVGRRVDPKIVSQYGGDPSKPYRVALRVLGMGDTNACDIAQGVHEWVLENAGLLSPSTKMIYGQAVPQGDLLEGAYLDDLLVLFRKRMDFVIPQDGSFIPPPIQEDDLDAVQTRAAEQGYLEAGLRRAEHKSFRGEVNFKAWGASVDGISGKVGCPLNVRRQVWKLLWQVTCEGKCTKNILQKLLGYVCFIFQFRREFYALQHHIYKYVDSMPGGKCVRLPAFVIDEIRSIMLHIPFSVWNMRRELSEKILATDAAPTAGGATTASVPSELARKLWSCCETRGEAVRLDRDQSELEWLQGKEPKAPSQLASTVAESLEWKVVSSYHFRQTSHINLQEARALRKEVVRATCGDGQTNQVQLCLNDSRVVCGAVTKGRSSSFKLNGILRSMIPFLTLSNIVLALLWIQTDSNPADHPSRGRGLPPPRLPPNWLRKFGVGSWLKPGLEVFAGSARITKSFLAAGFNMLDPVDILWGVDAWESWIDRVIQDGSIGWLWLAPPCCSFSALRNLDPGGPLRPKGCPQGDERIPEVKRGNELWRRGLHLAWLALCCGIPFFLEHPANSKAWELPETKRLLRAVGVKCFVVDWCAYPDHDRLGDPNRKPTRLVTTAGWLESVVKRCPGNHNHGPPLRGSRAKHAGAYPWGFCEQLVCAYKEWYGATPECRTVSVLPKESCGC